MIDTYLLSISLVRVRDITPTPRLDHTSAARADALGLARIPLASDAPPRREANRDPVARTSAAQR
ncbi:MAG TPA: hypothetical protein VF155_04945 [Candidatus Dormibacteraeota bacterium]